MQFYELIFSSLVISLVWMLILLTALSRRIRGERNYTRLFASISLAILGTGPLILLWWYIFASAPSVPTLPEIALLIALFLFTLYPLLKCTTPTKLQGIQVEDKLQEQGWIRRNKESIEIFVIILILSVFYTIYEGRITLFFVFYLLPLMILFPILFRRSSSSEET